MRTKITPWFPAVTSGLWKMAKPTKACKTLMAEINLSKKIKNKKLVICLNNILVKKNISRPIYTIKTQGTKPNTWHKQNKKSKKFKTE